MCGCAPGVIGTDWGVICCAALDCVVAGVLDAVVVVAVSREPAGTFAGVASVVVVVADWYHGLGAFCILFGASCWLEDDDDEVDDDIEVTVGGSERTLPLLPLLLPAAYVTVCAGLRSLTEMNPFMLYVASGRLAVVVVVVGAVLVVVAAVGSAWALVR